jgi:hypothetical protein
MNTVQHLDHNKIAQCSPALYIDRNQLIIRHLHWLMIVQSRCHTALSSARAGAISPLKLQRHCLRNKVIVSGDGCCLDVVSPLVSVSLKLKDTAERL